MQGDLLEDTGSQAFHTHPFSVLGLEGMGQSAWAEHSPPVPTRSLCVMSGRLYFKGEEAGLEERKRADKVRQLSSGGPGVRR